MLKFLVLPSHSDVQKVNSIFCFGLAELKSVTVMHPGTVSNQLQYCNPSPENKKAVKFLWFIIVCYNMYFQISLIVIMHS